MRTHAQAVQFSRFGDVNVLDVVDIDMPNAGPGEIVVEVIAAAINHMEVFLRQGCFREQLPTHFPQRQGSDFAGTVVEVGSGVSSVTPGMDVIGYAHRSSHATHVVVPAENVIPKSAHLSWEVAGGLYLAGITAYEMVSSLNLSDGDTIVIAAAAGGVGGIETSLARLRGAQVIGTCSERNADHLRNVGVTPVVYGEGLVDRIRAVAPDRVSAYLDNGNRDDSSVARELNVPEARIRTVGDRRKLELTALSAEPDVGWTHTLAHLAQLIEEHAISVPISGFYPLERVREAFDDLDNLHARGKVVLGMQPVHYKNQRVQTSGIRTRDVVGEFR